MDIDSVDMHRSVFIAVGSIHTESIVLLCGVCCIWHNLPVHGNSCEVGFPCCKAIFLCVLSGQNHMDFEGCIQNLSIDHAIFRFLIFLLQCNNCQAFTRRLLCPNIWYQHIGRIDSAIDNNVRCNLPNESIVASTVQIVRMFVLRASSVLWYTWDEQSIFHTEKIV